MSIRKRMTAFASAAALFITILPASVSAHDGKHQLCKGSFVFYDKATDSDIDATFYYSDEYFERPSTQMDEHLRTMSLNLALASSDKDKNGNIYDIFSKTGFDSETVQTDEMSQQSKDTIGTIIANKTTDDDRKLVVMVFNGTHYNAEWESNLTVGTSGDAEGFSKAAKKAYDRLADYIGKHDLKGAKLWMTGYSRGGAVADMMGKLINENLDEFGITESDLYDYTFATPRASEKALGYANIHDIIDPYDIIPRLMPKGWGIDRAGTEYLIPCAEQTVQPKIINVGNLMLGTDLIIDKTEEREDPETGEKETVPVDPIPADKFLDDFSKLLSDNITRESYDAERDSIPALVTRLILTSSSDYSLITFIADTFKGAALSLLQPAYNLLYNPIDSQEYKQTMEELPATLAEILDSSENKDKISKEDFELTKKALPAMLRVFVPAIKGDTTNPIDLTKSFEKIATLIGSIKPIITNHFSSSYYAKLTALDSYYSKPAESMRIWGNNRYETSLKAADRFLQDNGFEKFPAIIIATGMDYADALSAAYLAKAKNSPIILTNNQSAVQQATLDYIHANCDNNTQIYIVGGEAAVSFRFQKLLTSMAPAEQQYNVLRLSGENRYETNIAILKEAGVTNEELIIASGLDDADALSASATGKPILLTAKKLTEAQLEYLKGMSGENAAIAGGTGAVSEAVEEAVKAVFKNVDRIGGKTRFETSRLIAEKYFDKPMTVALAYAMKSPDGLVAAPIAMLYNCPILLVTDKNYTAASEYAKAAGTKKSITFGGTGVIADETVTSIVPAIINADKA